MRPETGPSHPFLEQLDRRLDALREHSLYRTLEAAPLDFCSNDYLGLGTSPEFARTVADAIQESVRSTGRIASTGSRLLSGHGPHWDELEEAFSVFVGSETALYFGSGYAANLGLLGAIAGPEDTFFSDAANHASLIDGMRLSRARKVVFPHLDLDFLDRKLRNSPPTGERFIVVESVFSMDGDRAPLDELARLAERHRAGLVIDEAHATGVFGPGGRGLTPPALRESGPLVATVSTCGKALAAPGAFVAGKRVVRDFLVNSARTFIFSTALPPYAAAHVSASLEAVSGADDARTKLVGLATRLREGLTRFGADIGKGDTQIVPVFVGSSRDAVRVADGLGSKGLRIRPIRPPTVPEGSARLRLSVTANMADAEIDRVVDAVREST
jgi:8-amino-7-oxononanoate synthase